MKKLKFAFSVLAVALALTVAGQSAVVGDAAAQERTTTEKSTMEKTYTASDKKMHTVSPERARMVVLKLKAPDGTSETTCCTNWNSSTGGTGCATFPDECPAGQFKVECGASGCW